jgi:hypothetical protein
MATLWYQTEFMKGVLMKMSHVWKSSNRKKKTKPTYKIHWEALGLSRPDRTPSTLSIEAIRSEVSVMAAQGLSERPQTAPDNASAPERGRSRRGTSKPMVDRKNAKAR